MGYNTDYTLTMWYYNDQEKTEIEKFLAERTPLAPWADGYNAVDTWYHHDEDMCALSGMFPHVLFVLDGIGDCPIDDMWRKYYKNGKVQHAPAIITYDEFDENKLEELEC